MFFFFFFFFTFFEKGDKFSDILLVSMDDKTLSQRDPLLQKRVSFRGSNSVIFIPALFLNWDQLLRLDPPF